MRNTEEQSEHFTEKREMEQRCYAGKNGLEHECTFVLKREAVQHRYAVLRRQWKWTVSFTGASKKYFEKHFVQDMFNSVQSGCDML